MIPLSNTNSGKPWLFLGSGHVPRHGLFRRPLTTDAVAITRHTGGEKTVVCIGSC